MYLKFAGWVALCGILSGCALFAEAYLSQYFGLLLLYKGKEMSVDIVQYSIEVTVGVDIESWCVRWKLESLRVRESLCVRSQT